jgi:ribonuclease-3
MSGVEDADLGSVEPSDGVDERELDPGLARLQRVLGHAFRDAELLRTALTHRSAANESGATHYERLEFLGDAVLGLAAAEWLFETLPDEPEGRLARFKSYVVSTRALAEWARELELGAVLVLGAGEERSGGRDKQSLLADALEAVLGAVYLDGGLPAVREVVRPWLAVSVGRGPQLARQEAKTVLQEALQSRGEPLPEYRLVDELGPPHERTFRVECWMGERLLGVGEGGTKKAAERAAAEQALETLDELARAAQPDAALAALDSDELGAGEALAPTSQVGEVAPDPEEPAAPESNGAWEPLR